MSWHLGLQIPARSLTNLGDLGDCFRVNELESLTFYTWEFLSGSLWVFHFYSRLVLTIFFLLGIFFPLKTQERRNFYVTVHDVWLFHRVK